MVAETLEAAIEGAEAVRATYAEEPFSVLVTDPGAVTKRVKDVKAGDAAQAMASAVTTIEVEYDTPPQHHNPIELLITTAIWSGGRLTIHESTQGASVVKAQVATSLGLDPAIIDVKSSYIGGSFGQKGSVQVQTAIVARAAILTRRPVKLVMPRGQIFHVATFRPLSRHRIKIGTDTAGMMIAVNYDADHQQSRHGWFAAEYYEAPLQMYGIPMSSPAPPICRSTRKAPATCAHRCRFPDASPSRARSTNWRSSLAATRSSSGWHMTRRSTR